MICGSGGSKSRWVRSRLGRWEMNNCTPLWREANFQVKMYKAPQLRSAFRSWDVEKVHAVVARSAFRSQNVQNTSAPDRFWKLRWRKSARRCGAKHISKSKCTKHTILGALLEVEMSKKCTPLWPKHIAKSKCTKDTRPGALFEVEMSKRRTPSHVWTTFGRSDVVSRGRRKGLCAPCQKSEKREGFVAFPKTMAGVGHLKRIWKDAFRVAGAVQKTCSSEMLGGQGADFLIGVAFWSIRSSVLGRWFCVKGAALRMTWNLKRIWKDAFRVAGAVQKTCSSEMLGGQGADFLRGVAFWSIRPLGLLRWFCVTSAALRMTWHHFAWQAQHFTQMEWKNRKTHWYEAVSSALNFPLLKEILQNCFVCDVANLKKWGSLADLLRFGCCQVQKMKRSRRIPSFFMLSTSKIEEVLKECFVFDVVKLKQWGNLAELLRFQDRQIDR